MRAGMNQKADVAEALLLRARTMSRQVESAPTVKKSKEEIGPAAFIQRALVRRLFISPKGETDE